MKIINGYPCFNSADDAEDSAVAAALALLCDYPIEFDKDIYFDNYMYKRCNNAKYSVSRDQYIAISTVIYLKYKDDQNLEALVDTSRVNGNDILLFNGSHTNICKGKKPTWLQTQVFKKQLWYSAKYKPHGELNQLFIQLLIHPDKSLIKSCCKANPEWFVSVNSYLFDRDEKELATMFVNKIKSQLSE